MRHRVSVLISILLMVGLLVAACAPTQAPAPAGQPTPVVVEKIVEKIVEKPVEKIVEKPVVVEKIVEKEVVREVPKAPATVTVYSGRSKSLVGPILEQASKDTGIEVRVRYGDTAQLAAAILEEGKRTPADVFFAQDAGALGAISKAGMFTRLPDRISNLVDAKFRSPKGEWVGVSGRARVVVYNTQALKPSDLPESVYGFTDPKWKGKIGWAPTNASLQAFVTAMRKLDGEVKARQWLDGIKANSPKKYNNNTSIVQAVAAGEIHVGFVNHYYLFAEMKQKGDIAARNYYPKKGDVGALMNVAGAGVINVSQNKEAAERFIEYLLSTSAQQYFTKETFEYPMLKSVPTHPDILSLSQIEVPNIDLSNLDDLDGTLKLLRDLGIL